MYQLLCNRQREELIRTYHLCTFMSLLSALRIQGTRKTLNKVLQILLLQINSYLFSGMYPKRFLGQKRHSKITLRFFGQKEIKK